MNLEEALSYLDDHARREGADAFDIVAGESDSSGIEIFRGKIKSTEISGSRGIGIRLFRSGHPGYSFTEKLSPDALRQTLKDALDQCVVTDELKLELPEPSSPADIDLKQYDSRLDDFDLEAMKDLGLRLEKETLSGEESIENVPYLGVSRSRGRSLFLNSLGHSFSRSGASMGAYVGAVARRGEIRKMGMYSNGGRRADSPYVEPAFMAAHARERAVEMLEARPADGGEYPAVFSHRVSGRLLAMFNSPFSAENVQKGQSRLKDRLGEKIASEALSIRSDPHIPEYPGSRLFDDEGVPTRPLQVVENGVLLTYLHNLESAARDGLPPTGTGNRGYSGKAGAGYANMIVAPGERSLEDLLQSHSRCLYVVKLEGGAGCSAISGEISIGIQGFLYENGTMVHPVDRMTLNINYFDLLPRIEAFSSEYSDSFSSVKTPDMLIDGAYFAA